MHNICIALCAIFVLFSQPCNAGGPDGKNSNPGENEQSELLKSRIHKNSDGSIRAANLKNLDKPIELDAGESRRMYVIFNHSSHKDFKCRQCHHEGLPGDRYAPCTGEGCHAITSPASRDPLSVYMAYHSPRTTRSCLGCHKSLVSKYPDFKGCRPCHETPMGRKMRATAKASQSLPAASR